MKVKKLLPFVFILFGIFHQAKAVNVIIIESGFYTMDEDWLNVCTGLGYNAAIYQQSILDSTYWFDSTDVLISSDGVDNIPANRVNTIQLYLAQGGRVYLQAEYDCGLYEPNAAFEQMVNALGGSFNWQGVVNGNLEPMQVLGSLSTTPNVIPPLSYFWYGCAGLGNGCNSHIEPFLEYGGQYFGFIFCVPGNSTGRMITTCDQDWIQSNTSVELMENIAVNLANPQYSCAVPGGLNVNLGNDTAICTGDSILLNAQASGANSYLWSTGSNASSITVDMPGTYWVRVSDNSCYGSDTIHVAQKDGVPFTFTLSDSVICQGDSATLVLHDGLHASIAPLNGISWQGTSVAFLYPDSTTVYTLTAQNVCGSNDTEVIRLTVSPKPVALLSANTDSICSYDSVQICAPSGFTSYTWSNGAANNCIQVTAAGNYYVMVIDNNGCTAQSNTKGITVLQPPIAIITANPDSICSGDSAQICASSGFTVYAWNPAIGGTTGACIETENAGNYSVIITGNNGCTAESNVIGIRALPLPSATISSNFDTVCSGDSAQICAETGFSSYIWNPAVGGTIGHCIETESSGNYYVNVTDNNGCTAESNIVSITVLPRPGATISPNISTICPDDSAQICAPTGFSFYNWNIGPTGTCIETENAGDYYVTVTDNSGCTAESNHIGITVFQSPPVSTSRSGDTLRVYNAMNVQWYLDNSPINGATQNIYIADTSGNYTVSVTDSNGCSTFSSPIVYTGISDINDDDNIFIYPNPLSVGNWQLTVGNNYLAAQIEIFDDNGRLVYKSEIKNTHSEIDAPFAGGIYLLQVTTGVGVAVRKLVKL